MATTREDNPNDPSGFWDPSNYGYGTGSGPGDAPSNAGAPPDPNAAPPPTNTPPERRGGTTPTRTGGTADTDRTGAAPTYVNMQDPVHKAVWDAFQKKGLNPRDQSDFQYWVDHINNSQGGWGDQGNQQYWLNRMAQSQGGVGDYQERPEAGAGTGPGGSYTDKYGAQNQALIDALMKRANQSLTIDPKTDSVIRPQVDDFAAAQTQSNRNSLNDLVESSSPYSTGANTTAATQLAEQAGKSTASMQSQLVQNELTSRRTEIQNALSELGSILTADQQMSLQEELGKIDASLRQQQINSNNDQFAQTFGLNQWDRQNYWDALHSGLLKG